MSGPYSKEELEDIVKGPFQSSPLVVSIQPQEGLPDKIRICRHLSKSNHNHPSTNDHVDADKFPTRFGSASQMAEIVSTFLFCHLFRHLFFPTPPLSFLLADQGFLSYAPRGMIFPI